MSPKGPWQGPIVLDTDVASWLHTGRAPVERFRPLVANHVLCLPFAVVGEMRKGAIKAKWGERRLQSLEAFVRRHVVLPADDEVTNHWASLNSALDSQVDAGDIWVAACALRHRLPVVTGNLAHFQRIAGRFPELRIFHPDLE